MPVKISNKDNRTTAFLSGEIDHHMAPSLRREIDFAIRENRSCELILDFSEVTFMDSSGIGLVMGRYKLMNELGGSIIIQNPPPAIKKVMKLSGIDRLADICTV